MPTHFSIRLSFTNMHSKVGTKQSMSTCSDLNTLLDSVSGLYTVSFQLELKLHKLNKTSTVWGICAKDIQVKVEQKLDVDIERALGE